MTFLSGTHYSEIVVNLHIHTPYSDGHASHAQIAQAALRANIDAVIITDHNVYVTGPEGYYQEGDRKTLMLIGEEVHDQARQPQKNHLLIIGAQRELATLAYDPQILIDSARQAGGLSFLAHPYDPESPAVGEGDISWVSWEVSGYTGIELWNGLSEFKSLLKSKAQAIYYAYNPRRVAHGPLPVTLQRWDELTLQGRRIVAIGGSDAHALPAHMGPLHRTLFPYEFHFNSINTHLLLSKPLSGNYDDDRKLIIDSLAKGHTFIGNDLPGSTRGFRFTAQGKDSVAIMGDEIWMDFGVTLQIHLPGVAECCLLHNGNLIKVWRNRQNCTYITTEPGVYRLEVYIQYKGARRGWIFSNPIYVRKKN